MEELRPVITAVLAAVHTGARISSWERGFCHTLEEILERDEIWLSPNQKRSLFTMAENMGLEGEYLD